MTAGTRKSFDTICLCSFRPHDILINRWLWFSALVLPHFLFYILDHFTIWYSHWIHRRIYPSIFATGTIQRMRIMLQTAWDKMYM